MKNSLRPRFQPGLPVFPFVAAVALAAVSSSCAMLQQLGAVISPPKVSFLGAELVRSPSQLELTSYYCPRLLAKQAGGLAFATDLVCSRFFGKPPTTDQMLVGFDLRFEVANPNQVPIPLSEILTAIKVFPGQTQQNLGAVCLRVCDPGDASCMGGASSEGCQKTANDVKSLNDFPAAAARVLIAQGLGTGTASGRPAGFELPKVVANSKLAVTARLALTPEAFLPALEELARRSVTDLKAGKQLAFEIPYDLQGTVFANLGTLGRVAAGFGPVAGVWPVPTERLIPAP